MKQMPVLTPADLRTLAALHRRLGDFLNGRAPQAPKVRRRPARTRMAKQAPQAQPRRALANVPE